MNVKPEWSTPALRTLSVSLDTATEGGSGVDATSREFVTPA